MKKPFFSVIIATYNRRRQLEEAVGSVLSQSYEDFELIIVDDHSEDETPDYLAGLDDDRIRVFTNEKNMHVSHSRNTGIEKARGEWIVFLDDDDRMLPEKLRVLADTIAKSSRINFIHHKVWVDYLQDNKRRLSNNRTSRNYREELLVSNIIGGPNNVAIRRDLLSPEKGFDTSLRFAEEYELWIRLSGHQEFNPVFLDIPLATISIQRGTISLDKDLDAYTEAYTVISQRYRDAIASLSKSMLRKREENFYRGYAARCIYGNKRLCASWGFLKAFRCSMNPKYIPASILSLLSPVSLIRLYR